MGKYPKTMRELLERFSSESASHEYLTKVRWPEGLACTRCHSNEIWKMSRGEYCCSDCNYQFSVTSGTLFQDRKRSLTLWLQAMWYAIEQKNGVSAVSLQKALGLGSYHTAWTWLHKIRTAMVRPGRDKLSGHIEADETYLGGPRPGKRGRGADNKELVLILAQRNGKRVGRIRLHRIADASAKSLTSAIEQSVEPGTRIDTDGWRSYSGLKHLGYAHQVIREEANVGENLLPLVNIVASLLKRWLLGTHQGRVNPSHLAYYLDEYTFRFNRRTSKDRGLLFYRLVQQAVQVERVHPTSSS